MRSSRSPALLLAVTFLACSPVPPAVAAPGKAPDPPLAKSVEPWVNLTLEPAIPGFQLPLFITHAGDGSGRVFVAEQGGLVRVVKDGKLAAEPFLDVGRFLGNVGGEQGFLGLAFHPKFKENGRLFLAYTDAQGDDAVAEVRATADRAKADLSTLRALFAVEDFASNHNGGMLAFGPDGLLYIGTGDGGGGGDPQRTSQNDESFLGKMLVLDVDKLPAPSQKAQGNAQPRVAWKGLRNPWRYSFDRATGDMWLADVGQNRFEFLFHVPRARLGEKLNFGWSVVEGAHCFRPKEGCDAKGFERVVFEYPHGEDGCSITGGYVYRGALHPTLQGTYLVGDYCTGRIWMLRQASGATTVARALDARFPISSFGEDEAGEIWVADHAGGSIRRVALKPSAQATPTAAPR